MNNNQRAPPSRSSTQAAAQSLQSSHPNAVLDQGVHTRTSSMLHPSTTSSIPLDPWASSHESVATLYGGRPALPADAECPTPDPIWMLCQLDEHEGKALRMPLASRRNFLCAIGVTRMHDGVDSELANKIILEWYHLQRVNRARQHKAAIKQQPTFARYLSQQPAVPISVDAEAALKRVASRRKENKKDTPASADSSPEKPPRLDISYEHQIGQLKERLQNFKV
ncbi:hypothetical protein CB0940_02382 [Cercospora beticola]|uniref:Uncharacterized protein n=1 Tax=Cercospora beticola TaxID=122368 RepID=A0A2G5I2W9_CERBT|nr:hypothetical protein CB0940_02382 [Cercospora beticola]PIA99101.1 hypothetical protein CB0940_02382 [Cercospora beticola]WPA99518.1 hypothetical protein RHO25_004136 [Cercospora beticola]